MRTYDREYLEPCQAYPLTDKDEDEQDGCGDGHDVEQDAQLVADQLRVRRIVLDEHGRHHEAQRHAKLQKTK